jgi:effector-binding domain-containing protein/carbon monoxide dehydrogenase subunit G
LHGGGDKPAAQSELMLGERDMVRKILIGVGALLAVLAAVGFLLPSTARVERATVVKASPEDVFVIVNDLTRLREWASPMGDDPKATIALSGPPMGVGARIEWVSAAHGSGSQEIVESEPFSVVRSKMGSGGVIGGHSTLALAPAMGGTKVTWSFEADLGLNPIDRYLGLLLDVRLGSAHERGLQRLKALVEPMAEANLQEALAAGADVSGMGSDLPDSFTPADADPEKGPQIVSVEGRNVIRVQGQATVSDDAAISAALGEAYGKILTFAEQNGLDVGGGAPQAVTLSTAEGVWSFEAAMPLLAPPGSDVVEVEGVEIGKSYAGRAVKLTHKGPYSTLSKTYERLREHARANGLKEKGVLWEEYVTDPAEIDEDALLTNVYLAVE